MSPPPPVPSPSPPDPGPEEPSEVRRVTVREAKELMQAHAAAKAAEDRTKRLKRYMWGAASGAVAVVVVTVSVLAYGQSAIDGGVTKGIAPVAKDVARHDDEIKQLQRDMVQVKVGVGRVEVMAEMLLKDRGMRPPPRAPKDSGP